MEYVLKLCYYNEEITHDFKVTNVQDFVSCSVKCDCSLPASVLRYLRVDDT